MANNEIPQHSPPLVSVLVPIYNVSSYVEESIKSIQNQTYRNLEIIIVDDCSTDGTYEIVSHMAAIDNRIVLIRNEINSKIVVSLNRAWQRASGEYIARCDGDDIMATDRIERQMAFLAANPDIALVGCSFNSINKTGVFLRHKYYPSGPALLHNLLPYCSPVSHIWLARRSVYEDLKGYRLASVEDYDFLLRADLLGYKFDNLADYNGMAVRMRDGNTVSTFGLAQRRLFNYAKHLYMSEQSGGNRFHSIQEEREIIQKSTKGIIFQFHRLSDWLSQRGAKCHYSVVRFIFYSFAAVISPYKAQLFYFTARRNILINVTTRSQDKPCRI